MKINFLKLDIAKALSKEMGYSILYCKKLVNDLLRCMVNEICDQELLLKNFGTFKKLKKKERMGRNPKTKKEFLIKSRKSIKFITSQDFKKKINLL